MEIIHVPYNKIDRVKWDRCISNAVYGSLYATVLYLDHVAGKWDALVGGDYETVMPLIFKSKGGIKYLHQPAFLPMSGIFSEKKIPVKTTNLFISKAFSIFKYADLALAPPAVFFGQDKKIKTSLKNNFVIRLDRHAEKIRANYDPSFTKSLRRLQKLELEYSESTEIKEVLSLFLELYGDKISMKKNMTTGFYSACVLLQQKGDVIIRKATDKNGQLLCTALLLRFKGRLYNMISCMNPEGKKAEANYFLYDNIIGEFAGKALLLDLEGSDIKGIAYFYQKMGGINEPYQFIRYNNLPALLRLIKK